MQNFFPGTDKTAADMENESHSRSMTSPSLTMPTSRLRDIVEILETKQPSVLNLDTCLTDSHGVCDLIIFEYILDKIVPSITTLSLRFNNIKDDGGQILLEWLANNSTLEILYLMGTNISPNMRQNIENVWKKNLVGHRTSNMGYTLIRVKPKSAENNDEEGNEE